MSKLVMYYAAPQRVVRFVISVDLYKIYLEVQGLLFFNTTAGTYLLW